MYKILAVDDEPLICEGLKDFFPWHHYGFIFGGCAYNGSQATELLRSDTYHLVITDVRMPVMDGISLTEYVKRHFPNIQVIILSGHKDFEYAQKAMRLGASGYLLKPIQKNEFRELLIKTGNILNSINHVQQWGSASPAMKTEPGLSAHSASEFDNRNIIEKIMTGSNESLQKAISEFLVTLYKKNQDGEVLPIYQKRFEMLKFLAQLDPVFADNGENLFNVIPAKRFLNLLNDIDNPAQTKDEMLALCMSVREIADRRGQAGCAKLLPVILEHINDNLEQEISLKSIAAQFYVSPVYLGKIFKRETGKSFNDYLHQLRLDKAKSLVTLPDISINEIIRRTGYKNPEYFYKMFKKHENISFSDYRKSKQ